jgi:hypothetical protein
LAYAQTSYPNTPLGDGSCGLSISQAGCYVTTDADLLTWMGHPIDPPGLNAEYLAKGLFQGGCLISSDTLSRARPDQVQLGSATEFPGAADLTLLDTTTDGVYVAARINFPHGLPSDPTHFLPLYSYKAGDAPSTIQVVDSWDGQIKPLARYGDPATIVSAIMRYKALVPAPPPPPAVPPPQPVHPPSPVVPFTGDPKILEGHWAWEFTDEGDYVALKALGFRGVIIRAFNGSGGATAAAQLASWQARSVAARAAGLEALAWTYWYGPGEAGYTEPDPAAYLMACAQATAALKLDTPGWVIDVEAHQLDGLPAACKLLRDLSGKAVFPCPPGDPVQFGFKVDWPALDAAVDGYVPQIYTGAWAGAVTMAAALAEWTPTPPIYPASDEQDPAAAGVWVAAVKAAGLKGWSAWRLGTLGPVTLAVYSEHITPPVVVPPVVVPPVVVPPVDPGDVAVPAVVVPGAFVRWLRAFIAIFWPTPYQPPKP